MEALVVQGGVLLVFLALEKVFPRSRVTFLSRQTWINVVTGGLLFALKAAFVALLYMVIGGLEIPRLVPVPFRSPFAQLAFAFVISDFCRYWLHRAHHEVAFLWRFHRVHHSCRQLNVTSGLRMHLVDFIQLALLPFLLFGVIFDTRAFDARVWTALAFIVAAMDAFSHADMRYPLEGKVAKAWYTLFNTPHFHSWHHTTDPERYNGNYSQTLVIWDRLFGTAVDEPRPPEELGLDADQDLEDSIIGLQLLRPSRSTYRAVSSGSGA